MRQLKEKQEIIDILDSFNQKILNLDPVFKESLKNRGYGEKEIENTLKTIENEISYYEQCDQYDEDDKDAITTALLSLKENSITEEKKIRTHKIYLESDYPKDRSIEFFWSPDMKLNMLISYSKQDEKYPEGKKVGGFKTAKKKLLVTSDKEPQMVAELSLRKDLEKSYYEKGDSKALHIEKEVETMVELSKLSCHHVLERQSFSPNKANEHREIHKRRTQDRTRIIVEDLGIDLVDFFNDIFYKTKQNKVSPLTTIQSINLLGKICLEVEKIHRKGFIHYDLKLENIMWSKHKQKLTLIDHCFSDRQGNIPTELALGTNDPESERRTSFSLKVCENAKKADDMFGLLCILRDSARILNLTKHHRHIKNSLETLIYIYTNYAMNTHYFSSQFTQRNMLADSEQYKEVNQKGLQKLEDLGLDEVDNIKRLINISILFGRKPNELMNVYKALKYTGQLEKIKKELVSVSQMLVTSNNQLCQIIVGKEFAVPLEKQVTLLKSVYSGKYLDLIGKEYQSLLKAIQLETPLEDTKVVKTSNYIKKMALNMPNRPLLLHLAIRKGNMKNINILIDTKCIDINQKDKLGRSALYLAIEQKKFMVIEKLLINGAHINKEDITLAKKMGEQPTIDLLKKHLEISQDREPKLRLGTAKTHRFFPHEGANEHYANTKLSVKL